LDSISFNLLHDFDLGFSNLPLKTPN